MIRRARAQARRAGVADRVVFAGERPDPVPLLRASDVLVLPSAYEANALVVLEALACGVPVVSTRVGFAPDLIVDGENGFLVERDAAAIGARLAELDAQPLDAWRERARRTAEQHSWREVAGRYLALAHVARGGAEPAPVSDRLRILHAIRSDGFSGVEQFVLRLARTQAADGHEVTVIGGDPPRMRPGLDEVGVEHLPAARTHEVARAVRRLAREVDVVNTHMTAADVATVAALAPLPRSRRPAVVATCHFARPRGRVGPVPIDALVRRRIDAQISISAAVAAAIDGPSTVVHTGIESRPAGDQAARERTVLMAQRLQPEKRTDVGVARVRGIRARGRRLDARRRRHRPRTGVARAARRRARHRGIRAIQRLPYRPARPARPRRDAPRAVPG